MARISPWPVCVRFPCDALFTPTADGFPCSALRRPAHTFFSHRFVCCVSSLCQRSLAAEASCTHVNRGNASPRRRRGGSASEHMAALHLKRRSVCTVLTCSRLRLGKCATKLHHHSAGSPLLRLSRSGWQRSERNKTKAKMCGPRLSVRQFYVQLWNFRSIYVGSLMIGIFLFFFSRRRRWLSPWESRFVSLRTSRPPAERLRQS